MSAEHDRPRQIAHLSDAKDPTAEDSLRAVEALFDGHWLRKARGRHRLQRLWTRSDHIASSELYALGRAIKRLQPKHHQWLQSTAKTLKKSADTSHGLITEILTCGSTRGVGNAEVHPSKQGQPAVDFSVRYPSGFKYLVSVKNHDISIHEKSFSAACDELREEFIERLGILGKNGRLVINCEVPMTPEIFSICRDHIRGRLRDTGETWLLEDKLLLIFYEFQKENGEDFAKSMTSNVLIVWCRQHPNEQLNFQDKLKQAARNMKTHVRRSDEYARLLLMRVHVTADINMMEAQAKEMLDAEWDCGFDLVMLTQSTGVRNRDGDTSIYTTVRFAGSSDHQGLAQAAMRGERLVYEHGIGSVGTERVASRMKFGADQPLDLSTGRYEYQRGDFYYVAKEDERALHASMNSPAHGVHIHSVAHIGGQEIIFSGAYPDTDEVLII
jgi:hypothetical protein